MEEKQKPSLIERRLYARILQIMEDKKPLSRSTVQFVPVGQPRLHEPYPAILYLEQSDGYELQSLAGYLSGRVPHTGIFQVPHTRAAGVIQDGWVYLPYLFLPPIQGGDGQHSHRVLRQPIL